MRERDHRKRNEKRSLFLSLTVCSFSALSSSSPLLSHLARGKRPLWLCCSGLGGSLWRSLPDAGLEKVHVALDGGQEGGGGWFLSLSLPLSLSLSLSPSLPLSLSLSLPTSLSPSLSLSFSLPLHALGQSRFDSQDSLELVPPSHNVPGLIVEWGALGSLVYPFVFVGEGGEYISNEESRVSQKPPLHRRAEQSLGDPPPRRTSLRVRQDDGGSTYIRSRRRRRGQSGVSNRYGQTRRRARPRRA